MYKIFYDEDYNQSIGKGEIVTYGYYHKYWLPNGEWNPEAVTFR